MEFDDKEYLHAQIQIYQQKLFNLLRDNTTLESQIMLLQRHDYATKQENTSLRQEMNVLRQQLSVEPMDEAIDELDEILGCGCDGEEAEAEAAIAE